MNAVTAKGGSAALERYRDIFEARFPSEDALTRLRREALERFLSTGFPTQRHEDWKYTSLRRLETRRFALAERSGAAPAGALDALQARWIANSGTRIVLINGHCLPSLSAQDTQPPGVTVLSLGQWLAHAPEEVAAFLAGAGEPGAAENPVRQPTSPLEDLNLAFFEDGVVVNLADEVQLDEPVYVVHQWVAHPHTAGAPASRMSHPRVIVRLGRNSRCTLIEHYLGAASAECFTNAVTTIQLAAGAQLRHYRLQDEAPKSFHLGRIDSRLEAHSRYAIHDLALGASLGRSDIVTRLQGAGAHAALHGLFLPSGARHLDAHTRIDHIAPRTSSEEDYRGIAAGRGRGVFNGKVIVHPGAQKIDARQSSRNLLLNPGAEIDSKPELEIYADDVKCSHGATTGQLDANALFYLRSRGLSEDEARSALIHAFAQSVLASIEHAALREHLERRLDDLFASELRSASQEVAP